MFLSATRSYRTMPAGTESHTALMPSRRSDESCSAVRSHPNEHLGIRTESRATRGKRARRGSGTRKAGAGSRASFPRKAVRVQPAAGECPGVETGTPGEERSSVNS
jgi:hypothetical protein